MSKKFKSTTNTKISFDKTLFQIEALLTFSDFYGKVKKGELGGWLEKEENLTQDITGGWVSGGEAIAMRDHIRATAVKEAANV